MEDMEDIELNEIIIIIIIIILRDRMWVNCIYSSQNTAFQKP
jgi:hypothetical protein